ncbi:hypothetical protein [Litoreibacter halocynthiae]|uniref:hypothetical protein n=1 Tax=Litoreibacter halocynthiae TaxID=1242689 RepID=UPI0024933444|nr:hypothetical protein [Litoreibacter halocynthiae]
MGQAVDAVMFFNDPLQITGRIGVCLRQPQGPRAKLRAEPSVLDMAAQVDELAHQQPPIVVAPSQMLGGALERVMRRPWHLHKLVGPFPKVEVAHTDAAVFSLRRNAAVSLTGFGRAVTD